MWKCKVCEQEIEDDTWEQCWKCSSVRDLDEEQVAHLRERHEGKVARLPDCLRCQHGMTYAGTKLFHEGARYGAWFGNTGEFFVNREAFDVYFCPQCGKVEFYLDGIGDEQRGELSPPAAAPSLAPYLVPDL